MAKILIVSTSLNPSSYSFLLAEKAYNLLKSISGVEASLIDLRLFQLPFCNGTNQSAFQHPDVISLSKLIQEQDALILATPIYNSQVSASCKNFFELTSSKATNNAWQKKIVALLAKAGGTRSYMAPMSFLEGLMLDARCFIIPNFLYTSQADFTKEKQLSTEVDERLQNLVNETVDITKKLCS